MTELKSQVEKVQEVTAIVETIEKMEIHPKEEKPKKKRGRKPKDPNAPKKTRKPRKKKSVELKTEDKHTTNLTKKETSKIVQLMEQHKSEINYDDLRYTKEDLEERIKYTTTRMKKAKNYLSKSVYSKQLNLYKDFLNHM